MSAIVIRGGLLVRPSGVQSGDLLIVDGVIVESGEVGSSPSDALMIDASGCWVGAGFVDLHAHLREPGMEFAEDIESGSRAAALGGYSAIVAMPNTEPALDCVALVGHVLERGRRAVVDVAVAGAITVGRRGVELAPFGEMAELGVRLFTDDGACVEDAAVMRRALRYTRTLGVRLAQHCEVESLVRGGVANESAFASRLGLTGRPSVAESIVVARDIELVRDTQSRVHFMHISTRRSLELIRRARSEGLDVTCEVTPHHLSLDESVCANFDPTFKVNPPLRSTDDVAALRESLLAGEIDAVASDHAPHSPQSKDAPFDEAPSGVLGLEHAATLALASCGLVSDPRLFFRVMSWQPARIAQLRQSDERFGLSAHGGSMSVGEDANVVVFDPQHEWTVDREVLASKARNTPYHGWTLRGKSRATIVRGEAVVNEGVVR